MIKANGKDITKRSSTRRNRYLLVFNCQLAPAAAGRLGTLSKLDTKNPVMYMEFPEGRLRLRGTLVFPKNKYLVLRLGNKDVLCEDVMESMIVFSEAQWVGTVEENPDEVELPMPDSLKTEKRHPKVTFGGGGASGHDGMEVDLQTQPETQHSDDDDDDDHNGMQGNASQRSTGGGARRQTRGKRLRYAEDSDASLLDDDDDDDGDDDEPAPRKLPRAQSAGGARKVSAPSSSKRASSQQQQEVVM